MRACLPRCPGSRRRLARRCGSPASASFVMTAIVAWQVFGRYVLNQSPSWTEPASVLLMSWFIFLGAAVGVRDGNHLGFDVCSPLLPHGGQIMLADHRGR